jgi:S1-C subfamily serine protease
MNKLKFAAILAAGAALALSPAHVAAQVAAKPVSLGIQFSGNPEGTEAEVVQMLPDRTGAAMGFKVGDIVIEVGGKPVSREVLMAYMKEKKEGDQLTFKVKRAGAVIELTGKGMAAPEGAPAMTAQPEG